MKKRRIVLSDEELRIIQKKESLILKEFDRVCRENDIKYTIAYGTLLGAVRHKGFIPWDDDIDVCMLRSEYDRFKSICDQQLSEDFFYQSPETDKEYLRMYDKIRLNGSVFLETAHSNRQIHHGLYLDIFPVDNVPDDPRERARHLRHYSFFHTILSSKYISLESRRGLNKLFALIIRIFTLFIPLKWVYKKTKELSIKYNKTNCSMVRNYEVVKGLADLFPRSLYTDVVDVEFEGFNVMATCHYDDMLSKIYGDYMTLPPVEKRISHHDLYELEL